MQSNTVTVSICRITNAIATHMDDQLAIEEPLEIQLAYQTEASYAKKAISVTMRTPGNDEELASGFLFTEGVIKRKSEVNHIEQQALSCNRILVSLHPHATPLLQKTERNFYTTSSCGVCGKTSIESITTVSAYQHGEDTICVDAALFCRLPNLLRKQQHFFERTGGLHAAALFDLQGNFLMLREDVGRHNALDKVIGAAFLDDGLPLCNTILVLSGRASFELLQKAAMAGIKIVAAIGAPSSLAVDLAKESSITLIGFLGNEKFNIYCGEKRIKSFE